MNEIQIPTMIMGKPENSRCGEELTAFMIWAYNEDSYQVLEIEYEFEDGDPICSWYTRQCVTFSFAVEGFEVEDVDDGSVRFFRWRPHLNRLSALVAPDCDSVDIEKIVHRTRVSCEAELAYPADLRRIVQLLGVVEKTLSFVWSSCDDVLDALCRDCAAKSDQSSNRIDP